MIFFETTHDQQPVKAVVFDNEHVWPEPKPPLEE